MTARRTAVKGASPSHREPEPQLCFLNLCPHLRTLMIETGPRGRRGLKRLLDMPLRGQASHVGTVKLRTPCGWLQVRRENHPNAPDVMRISVSLDMVRRKGATSLGYVNGEVYVIGAVIPETVRVAARGRPLSDLMETPEGFPGRHDTIENARCLANSTRVLITRDRRGMRLDDFAKPPSRAHAIQ